ncbi:MAG TPA: YcxB family protein [Gemmatimonadaceae bacterium]|nr:YcxB family protein [Gemmatimonadaceae bacterium]
MASASTIIWRVEPREHVRAVRALQSYHARFERRLTREIRALGVLLLALAAAGYVAWRWAAERRAPLLLAAALAAPFAIAALAALWRPVALGRAARRQLRENPLALQERRYTFDSRGVKIAGESFSDEFPWRDIRHVGETPEFFLIFTGSSAYYLPKRAIQWPESLAGVREVFAEAIGDRARVR